MYERKKSEREKENGRKRKNVKKSERRKRNGKRKKKESMTEKSGVHVEVGVTREEAEVEAERGKTSLL